MFPRKKLIKAFFREKPVEILLSLREGPKYPTTLSKETDCTYSHTIKLLESFRKFGLVDFEKKGRIKIVRLTREGEELANAFYSVLTKLYKLGGGEPGEEKG